MMRSPLMTLLAFLMISTMMATSAASRVLPRTSSGVWGKLSSSAPTGQVIPATRIKGSKKDEQISEEEAIERLYEKSIARAFIQL